MLRRLGQRRAQIRYAAFGEQGYPIGSGIVESAGKLVVEARLKGSRVPACGCHWSPQHVNPLLALRSRLCSGQWEQTWPVIQQEWRTQVVQRQEDGRARRRMQRAATEAARSSSTTASLPKRERPKTIIDGRPTEAHPWKQRRTHAAA
jgi:hypothetical protein